MQMRAPHICGAVKRLMKTQTEAGSGFKISEKILEAARESNEAIQNDRIIYEPASAIALK
jgi:hypothetical protein